MAGLKTAGRAARPAPPHPDQTTASATEAVARRIGRRGIVSRRQQLPPGLCAGRGSARAERQSWRKRNRRLGREPESTTRGLRALMVIRPRPTTEPRALRHERHLRSPGDRILVDARGRGRHGPLTDNSTRRLASGSEIYDASGLGSAALAARAVLATMSLCLSLAGGLPTGGVGTGIARADTVISADSTATEVSAFGGALVWSRQQAPNGRYRLVQRVNGVTRDAPVPAADRPFNADLGPGRRGGIVAVYPRCRGRTWEDPVAWNPVACDVFQLDLRRGPERKLRRVSTKRCSESAPSIWRGIVAFERSSRFYDRRCVHGLYVWSGRGRPILLRKGKPDEGVISQTDIRDHTVAALIERDSVSSLRTQILLTKFGPRRRRAACVLRDKFSSGIAGTFRWVTAPTLDAGFLYWTRHESTLSPSDPTPQVNGFERVRAGCQGRIEIARRAPEFLGPATADAGTLYYTRPIGTRPSGVLRADGPPVSFSLPAAF